MSLVISGDVVVMLLLLPFGDTKLRLPQTRRSSRLKESCGLIRGNHRFCLHGNGPARTPIKIKPARLAHDEIRLRRGSLNSNSTEVASAGSEISNAPSLSGRVLNNRSPLV